MKVIGLTGGVGSGKSLVAQFLKEETGAELILTDDIGHIVTDKGGSAFEAVVERFGKDILSDHSIYRTPSQTIWHSQELYCRLFPFSVQYSSQYIPLL